MKKAAKKSKKPTRKLTQVSGKKRRAPQPTAPIPKEPQTVYDYRIEQGR
jgi:hypothetical protein